MRGFENTTLCFNDKFYEDYIIIIIKIDYNVIARRYAKVDLEHPNSFTFDFASITLKVKIFHIDIGVYMLDCGLLTLGCTC